MYRRPKFLEILIAIREEMARESDYDVDLFMEMARNRTDRAPAAHSMAESNSNGLPYTPRPRKSGKRK